MSYQDYLDFDELLEPNLMNAIVNVDKGYTKGVDVHYSVSEFFVVKEALKTFIRTAESNADDIRIAASMLECEPVFREEVKVR